MEIEKEIIKRQTVKTKIVLAARKYVDVPFVHQGRSEYGVDCLGLLMLVAQQLDLQGNDGELLANYDNLNYSKNPNVKDLRLMLEKYLTPKDNAEIGDIGLFEIDSNAQHLAIISDYGEKYLNNNSLGIIHAYQNVGRVVEHNFSVNWQRRLVQLFSI